MTARGLLAGYRCRTCGFVWKQQPGPVTCPACEGIVLDWVNYNDHDWLGDGNNGPTGCGTER